MNCLFAIPAHASDGAEQLAAQYTKALWALSDDVIALGDALRAYCQSAKAAVLELEDEDWAAIAAEIAEPEAQRLTGELFLSPTNAQKLRQALASVGNSPEAQTVALWLGTQLLRDRPVVLLFD